MTRVWLRAWRDTDRGREYSRTFEKKKPAEKYERDERSKQDRGAWASPDRMLISFRDGGENA